MVTRAGARTGLQLQGRGDTQGFNSPSVARLCRMVYLHFFKNHACTGSLLLHTNMVNFANDAPKTPSFLGQFDPTSP